MVYNGGKSQDTDFPSLYTIIEILMNFVIQSIYDIVGGRFIFYG